MPLFPQLDDFLFTEKLGRGSYATVYKAYRKDQKREVVAIKCVQKSSLTKSAVENLLTEISILKTVKHEHIVELKDFQWDSTNIYLILEYCDGGDLSQFIKRKRRLPESVVQRFLQQLAKAIQVLRLYNISHMDLKPQNILLSNRSNPILKLGDFGFAQYIYPDSEGYSLRGSPLYMAPEILLKHHYDARVDLWSVGIILYECLFGQAPFSSDTFAELSEKVKSSKPIELPYGTGVSDDCRHLLLGLLQRDPDKRLTFEEFFNHPFVDLEHMPTPESYAKGVELVQQAVNEDSEMHFEEAVSLYSKALEYLVPHASYETDRVKREEFRKKLFDYINRAEELKKMIKSGSSCDGKESLPAAEEETRKRPQDNMTIIGGLLYKKPKLQAALCFALEADSLVTRNNYEEALSLYQQALEIMVPAVSSEPSGHSKAILYAEVDRWMRKAEELKKCMQSKRKLGRSFSLGQHPSSSKVHFNASTENLDCVIQ